MSSGGASFYGHVRDVALSRARRNVVVSVLVSVLVALVVKFVDVIVSSVLGRILNRGRGRFTRVMPSRAAGRVLAGVVQMLPAGDRARYGEEFAAELDELAAAGLSRRVQLGYALRQAGRVWSLRAALRAPASTRGRSR